ncbi:MAG: cell division protein FtsL [Pseudomonadota bacterium]
MRTLTALLGVALLVGIASWAYRVNYETRDAERRVAELRRAIAEERAAIVVLRAEWAYLNRPDRLRDLAERHFDVLGLMPLDSEHFREADDLPWPEDEALPIFEGPWIEVAQ